MYTYLFLSFLKISTFCVGGGLIMLPLMREAFVVKRPLMTEQQMVDTVAIAQSLPGILAINMAVLIGYRLGGHRGVWIAAFAAVLTPVTAILLLASFLTTAASSPALEHAFRGVRSACCSLIFIAALKLAKGALKKPLDFVIMGVCAYAMMVMQINVIFLLLSAALFGLVLGAYDSRFKIKADR